eukprot:gene1434-2760_t
MISPTIIIATIALLLVSTFAYVPGHSGRSLVKISSESSTALFAHHPQKKIIKKIMHKRPIKHRLSDINRNNVNMNKCITKLEGAPSDYTIVSAEDYMKVRAQALKFWEEGDPTSEWLTITDEDMQIALHPSRDALPVGAISPLGFVRFRVEGITLMPLLSATAHSPKSTTTGKYSIAKCHYSEDFGPGHDILCKTCHANKAPPICKYGTCYRSPTPPTSDKDKNMCYISDTVGKLIPNDDCPHDPSKSLTCLIYVEKPKIQFMSFLKYGVGKDPMQDTPAVQDFMKVVSINGTDGDGVWPHSGLKYYVKDSIRAFKELLQLNIFDENRYNFGVLFDDRIPQDTYLEKLKLKDLVDAKIASKEAKEKREEIHHHKYKVVLVWGLHHPKV